jgi:cytochrome c5
LIGQSCVGIKIANTNTDDTAQSLEENTSEDDQGDIDINEALVGETDDFDVVGTYQISCFACHASGAAGAPLLGDLEAWNSRMEKGMDAVMANVITGINAMPAKGLCMDCTDNELRAIVDYMIAQ